MRFLSSKYYLQLIGYSLLLATLPVIILGIAAYMKSSQIIQEKVIEGNRQLLLQTHQQIEKELFMVDQMAGNIMHSSTMNILGQSIDSHHFSEVNQIKQSMNYLNSFELGVRDVVLVSLDRDWLISNGVAYNSFMNVDHARGMFREYLLDRQTSYWQRGARIDAAAKEVWTEGEFNFVQLVKKIPIYSPNPKGLLIVSVSAPQIGKMSHSTGTGEMLVLNENYTIFGDMDGAKFGESLLETPMVWKLQEQSTAEGYFPLSTEDGEFGVSYRKSIYTNWTYVSIVSISDIAQASNIIGWYTLFSCLFILLFTIVFSLLGSSKIYMPIRKLYDAMMRGMEGKEPHRTSNEIQVIGERLDVLLQSQYQMKGQIERQYLLLKEHFMLKLIRGEVNAAEREEKLRFFNMPASWNAYCLFALQIDTLDGTGYLEQDRDLLMFGVTNIISELIAAGTRLEPVLINDVQLTVIGWHHDNRDNAKHSIHQIAEMVQSNIHVYLRLNVSIGISTVYQDIGDLPKAYKEGLMALKYQVRMDKKAILHLDEVQPARSTDQSYPQQLESELFEAIEYVDRGEVDRKLSMLLETFYAEERFHQEYEMLLARLLLDLIRLIHESAVKMEAVERGNRSLFIELFQLKTLQEIEAWYKTTLIEPFMSAIEERNNSLYKKISTEVIDMIQKQFDSELTLKVCSQQLNYSVPYISRVFKKETGMNFSEYLSRYRLSIAKKWLVETDMTIGEIADKLKYNNTPNFSRYFKKIEGVAPGQYRDMDR